MTITLDDVACLLHLPIICDFYTPTSLTEEEAAALAVELLGVNVQFAAKETRKQRCGYFSQQWLFENHYKKNVTLRHLRCDHLATTVAMCQF
ncbi:serine/threonine-protein phosphatase 7 long form-like protein [Trifolium medium]|uniref:Serine/threonine-protein phosphatase 7 long form-like protein n=1 Tax=Trifolium medium TaxID=97028 RepID=A0A392S3B8_9FABA|nr:serine/threonine-protein phosphatase 7 long form-like protein [Trifolium medium]